MGFVVSDADRDVGVVYLDATRQDLASTHALVIGVGQYASDRLEPVGSPPLAARIMAEWFVDGMDETKPGGFVNGEKPLGSLSVLLSELPKGERSQFSDASIPRATFDNVRKAVKGWIKRANSHPDNFLFLFISSHGESFGRRTAFLLEDYGTEEDNITAGMSEIEQFVEALANVKAKQQLLIFDCCRTPTPLGLRFDQQFGTNLINPSGATDGLIRRAYVLRSTGLGFEALGYKDGPTVFAQVLIDALKGLASSSDNWTIDNFGLASTVSRLLGLHKRNGEAIQLPDNQLNAPFVISAVPPSDTAAVFVSLGPQHDFSTCNIHVNDKLIERAISGANWIPPFARLDLPKNQVKIAAFDAAGQLIAETVFEPALPVSFKVLPEPNKYNKSKVERVAGSKSLAASNESLAAGPGLGQIALSLDAGAASPFSSFIAVIRPNGTQAAKPIIVALSGDGKKTAVTVEPGRYDIGLDMSDGRTVFGVVDVEAGFTAEVTLHLPAGDVSPSPPAQDVEVLAVDIATRKPDSPRKDDPRNWLRQLGASEERILAGGWPGANIFAVPISPAFSRLLAGPGGDPHPDGGAVNPQWVTLVLESPGVFAVEDRIGRRLPDRPEAGSARLEDQPIWVAAVGEGWREIAAVPSIGVQGNFQRDMAGERDSWIPSVVVTPTPRAAASHIGAVVDTRQWSGLLAFLARRDFELSGVVLDDLVGTDAGNMDIRNALLQKVENPMAAVAAALVAVATGRLAQLKIPEQWLRNLTNWFPQLPDAPVILARHLMSKGEAGRAEVKAQLLEAYRRGVPLFSLSVDWLAQGLAGFADDPEAAVPAGTIRRFAQLCDPTRTFTVLRIPTGEDQAS
jgi:Caspase domain